MRRRFQLMALLMALLLLLGLLAGCTDEQAELAWQTAADLAETLTEEEQAAPVTALPDPTPEPTAEPEGDSPEAAEPPAPTEAPLDENGSYTTKEDVTAYLIAYGHLPPNFITKAEAQEAGWPGGSLEPYCPGKCIGGDRFGNREGLLPTAKGRRWTECDINTLGASSRGAERLVFSNDGLIYYTGDHYESFQQVYPTTMYLADDPDSQSRNRPSHCLSC